MDRVRRHELLERYFSAGDEAGIDAWKAALADGARLMAMITARQGILAGWVAGQSSYPEHDIAEATRVDLRSASAALDRAETAAESPVFGAALAKGDVSGQHVDALGRGLRQLKPERRGELLADTPRLALLAGQMTPNEFSRAIQQQVRRIESDADGDERLTRQRRAARLKTWVDRQTGMWRMSGTFDPVTGLGLSGKLQNALATLFNANVPDGCPDDPIEKQDFLRSHALVALLQTTLPKRAFSPDDANRNRSSATSATTAGGGGGLDGAVAGDGVAGDGAGGDGAGGDGAAACFAAADGANSGGSSAGAADARRAGGGAAGRAEIIIVVDTTIPDDEGRPRIDWGLPVEIPDRILAEFFNQTTATVHTVIVRNGVILHAPGRLDLGRTTRIASRAQRRALRGIYPTCAVLDCETPYELTKLHHVHWWRHGGRTDLANLLPLCSRHHHCVHDHGWNLHLAPDRTLTIILPDGATLTNKPPGRSTRQRGRQAA